MVSKTYEVYSAISLQVCGCWLGACVLKVIQYCETATCRRKSVLAHFGEQVSQLYWQYILLITNFRFVDYVLQQINYTWCKWPQLFLYALSFCCSLQSAEFGSLDIYKHSIFHFIFQHRCKRWQEALNKQLWGGYDSLLRVVISEQRD